MDTIRKYDIRKEKRMEYINKLSVGIDIHKIIGVELKDSLSTLIVNDVNRVPYKIIFSGVLDSRIGVDDIYLKRLSEIKDFEYLSGKVFEILNSSIVSNVEELSEGVIQPNNLHDFIIQDKIETVFEVICYKKPIVVSSSKDRILKKTMNKYQQIGMKCKGCMLFFANDAISLVKESFAEKVIVSEIRAFQLIENGIAVFDKYPVAEKDYSKEGIGDIVNFINRVKKQGTLFEIVFDEFSFDP